ncbi:MAG: hypothetical protein QOH61_1198 [Chloroflexota bacterium]|jgi:hypothetical protein|nr:hypothetical protein [Chloroflexota bacterium]
MTDPALGSLDFLYAPSTDVATDVQWFTEVLGAELVFAIDSGGTRVAMLRLGTDAPPVLVTDHLPDDRPVFLYRVASLSDASKALAERGWTPDRTIELPIGPAAIFHAPGGLRLAIYEPSRPFVVDSMAGQRDF